MKPSYEMTRQEAVERLRSLYFAQPKADWEALAVGNVILHKGYCWRIQHVPPKRGFVMATNVMTGEVEKLLRSRYATPDLLLTDEATLAVLRTSHQEEIRKAMAAGTSINPLVQYDYPELFTPYPSEWDEKRREKVQDVWLRINEMRAFHDRQDPPGWQFGRVRQMIAEARKGIARWDVYRAEVEAGVKIKKPEAIPRIVASVDDSIRELKEQVEILRHLRKHLERTVGNGETKRKGHKR
ncbi:MAG: hypothetical protein ACLQNE_32040 [Thermoguttaceae bacterium]|jgi:hypothetical protein